jgi:hypothetical protein
MVENGNFQTAVAISKDPGRNSLVYFRDQVFGVGDIAGGLDGVYYAIFDLG